MLKPHSPQLILTLANAWSDIFLSKSDMQSVILYSPPKLPEGQYHST